MKSSQLTQPKQRIKKPEKQIELSFRFQQKDGQC